MVVFASGGSDDSEPAAAGPEEPTTVVEEEPAVVLDDPVSRLTVTEAHVWSDPVGDVILELAFAAGWLAGTPSAADAWNMSIQVGVAFDGQRHATQWSLADGMTRGAGYIYGDVEASIEGEMWTTPEGTLVVKLPGLSPTGGLSSSGVGSDAAVRWNAQLILEEGGDI